MNRWIFIVYFKTVFTFKWKLNLLFLYTHSLTNTHPPLHYTNARLGSIKNYLKNLKISLWKKEAFDCAGIRAQVFRLPVDCFNRWATQASDRPGLESQRSRNNIEFICIICDIRVWNCLRGHLSTTYPIWYAISDPPIM